MNKIPMLERFAAQSLVEYDGELVFSKEKFAELIVRECIEQVITGPKGPAHYAVEAAIRLKKHFGVEE